MQLELLPTLFEENMVTDGNGHISHEDKRYYDFKQYYCNGHPLPPEPEPEEGEEEGEDEDLMEEWQAMVDACEEKAASCTPGTFHHWLCGSESEPEEAEAFEKSGCKANRDAAYENFICRMKTHHDANRRHHLEVTQPVVLFLAADL